jgi:GNAT superfamily N-acetyltransferase
MTWPAGDTYTIPVSAEPKEVEALGQVIADAFFDLAPSRWLIPVPEERRAIFPVYFRLYVMHALSSGIVDTTPDRTAVALWLPISESGPCPPPDYERQLTMLTHPWTQQFVTFDAALDRHHPIGTAHHHLAILAVRPDRQGRGIGSALLRGHHAALDGGHGIPAYLEASDLRTRRLYLAHGYRDCDQPIELPNGPFMYPMWRDPLRGAEVS